MTDAPAVPEREGAWAKLRRRKVVQWGLDYTALVVTIAESASQVMAMATQTRGTAQMNAKPTYGCGYNATGPMNSTSKNIYAAKSRAEVSAVLFITAKNRSAWYADVQVKAQETLFASEKGMQRGQSVPLSTGLRMMGIWRSRSSL